jgi:hypothetical protein
MKTQSELGKERHNMRVRDAEGIHVKTINRFVLALALALIAASNGFAGTGGSGDVCKQASKSELTSCETGAQSQYAISLTGCYNLTDPSARQMCIGQAKQTLADDMVSCGEQFKSRNSFCNRTGGGAYDPQINPADFTDKITNPYLPLNPGTTLIYNTTTPDGLEVDNFEVTSNTVVILGVTCLEVHDTVTLNGVLTEDTLDWFAQDSAGTVWYFGENAKQLSGGLIVGVEGSWTGGVNGAKPGIVMEANRKVGDTYRQEFAPGTSEDFGSVLSLNKTVTVPAGTYQNCVQTFDGSTLEPTTPEQKYYAQSVGNVLGIDKETGQRTELVQIITKSK